MTLDRIIAVRNDKTVYHDGNYSIKAFRSSVPMSYILMEGFFQSVAAEIGLPVPAIHTIREEGGRWALISDFIKGNSLKRLYLANADKREEYMEHFVAQQLKIHQKTYCGLPSAKVMMQGRLSQADLPEQIKAEIFAEIEKLPDGICLCHGDYTLSNIVVTEANTYYILDWSKAVLGSGNYDAAMSYIILGRSLGEEASQLYLSAYCKASGEKIEAVKLWVPYVAAMRYSVGNAMDRAYYRRFMRI
jgi:tRNA A-37 threonylcarbamoyl transferase component Bud32